MEPQDNTVDVKTPPPSPKGGWSEEQRQKFMRTQRRKKRLAAEAAREATNGEFSIKDITVDNPPKEDLPHVLVCPRCGLNMRNVALAIAFSNKQ